MNRDLGLDDAFRVNAEDPDTVLLPVLLAKASAQCLAIRGIVRPVAGRNLHPSDCRIDRDAEEVCQNDRWNLPGELEERSVAGSSCVDPDVCESRR